MTDELLARIAAALERIAPQSPAQASLAAHPAYVWDGLAARPVEAFAPAQYALLTGIDEQKGRLLENTRRHAAGLPAHDVLLWGARGTGKSASVGAVVGALQRGGADLALMQCAAGHLESLAALFAALRGVARPFILFIDDLGFDEGNGGAGAGTDARALRSLLDGGASARPANVRLYVTANRRHIVPRNLSEQDDPINVRDVVDDKMALSDRFGLSLGFHVMDQDTYLAIVAGYARHFDLPFDGADAVQWATQRGSRSGRVAWQYVTELAGREGKRLVTS
ncbi:MAG: ATP-binding protein [Sphingobium sp.]|nr:ATP-binding protein [Sphingobium sp.]MBP6111767.1 ATP-binding protein [Sphingobium sp.]MBP8671261.1 ATP-binding protein [Sphingobium sp.]MBP9156326.1 ATP-binding protein [Sphingobium sp.]